MNPNELLVSNVCLSIQYCMNSYFTDLLRKRALHQWYIFIYSDVRADENGFREQMVNCCQCASNRFSNNNFLCEEKIMWQIRET